MILQLDRCHLQRIEPLWQELNGLHASLSNNFKQHFFSFRFDARLQQWNSKKHLALFVARELEKDVGYCVVSADDQKGEIDSIYVKPNFQSCGIGSRLMENALLWLQNQPCGIIHVYIAEGNEQAVDFYNSFGFKKRFLVLQKEN